MSFYLYKNIKNINVEFYFFIYLKFKFVRNYVIFNDEVNYFVVVYNIIYKGLTTFTYMINLNLSNDIFKIFILILKHYLLFSKKYYNLL